MPPKVPEGDVDGRHRVGLVTDEVSALSHRLRHPMPERAHRARVFADDERGEQALDDRRGDLGRYRRERLAPADVAVVGLDLHDEGLVPRRVEAPPRRLDHVSAVLDGGFTRVGIVGVLLAEEEGEGLDARDSHRGLQ